MSERWAVRITLHDDFDDLREPQARLAFRRRHVIERKGVAPLRIVSANLFQTFRESRFTLCCFIDCCVHELEDMQVTS